MLRILLASIFLLIISHESLAKTHRELVTEFVKKSGSVTFGKDFKYFSVLIESKESEDYDDHLDEFTKAAKKFDEVKFVFINTDVEENWQVIEFLGLIAEDTPGVLFIEVGKGLKKYKAPFDEITKANIISFTEDCLAGKAEWYLKSDEVPDDWDALPVKVLVGKNFDKVVFGNKKAAFVYFYAPWCAACQKAMPEVTKLGKLYANNKDVLIAKFDSTANEIVHLTVLDVPTIALFLKDDPKPILYTREERTAEAFSQFITKTMKEKGAGDEEKMEAKQEPKKETTKAKEKAAGKKKVEKEETKERETKKAKKDIEKDDEKIAEKKKQKKEPTKEKKEKPKAEKEKKETEKESKKETKKDGEKEKQKEKKKEKDATKTKAKKARKEEL